MGGGGGDSEAGGTTWFVARFRVAVVALFAKGSGGECAVVVSRQAAGRGLLRVVYGRLDALKQPT